MFQAPVERIAFYIGNYPIMKYGITMGLAIAVSVCLLLFFRKKYYSSFSEDVIVDLSCIVIFAGIVGARLWYVLLNADYFSSNLAETVMIHHGGISIQGAIIGGIIGGYFYTKKKNLNFLKLADLYALVLPIGQAIGRWGNFFNSEAFGRPCDLPWKMFVSPENRPFLYKDFDYFHPAFLYESIVNVLIFVILFFFLRKVFKDKDGCIFFSYLLLYSAARYFIEFIRIDSVLDIFGIPVAVFVCVLFIIVSVAGLWKLNKSA
ncbi:MAG: prolipoprotein diacylglyceryl transferase [Candidatus Gastranaerophilales bacterium]|nr:prolipoprotein diacylglyceryl transferase [Candidatus Gastranaerophilales bacterium]